MPVTRVNIGIVGLGNVGTNVVKILQNNRKAISARCGAEIVLRRVCERDPRRQPGTVSSAVGAETHTPVSRDSRPAGTGRPGGGGRGLFLPSGVLTTELSDVLEDPEIDIVAELVGDSGPAYDIVTRALKRGKHVVTANKSLLAEHWEELIALAHDKGRGIQFEASVMSGVPVVRSLNEGLAGNTVDSILGILNGTTNYILTCIYRDGMDYASALKRAQAQGLAEADPASDVEGTDAAYKLSILCSIALGRWLPPKAVYREGIAGLEAKDIQYARKLFGYHPRLLAVFKQRERKVEAGVHPVFVPSSHPLAAVTDEYNAVHITARPAGSIMLYGLGAGGGPAASGVVSDVIYLARAVAHGVEGGILTPVEVKGSPVRPVPMEQVQSKYYMRFTTVDRYGVLAKIAGAFGGEKVSIQSVYQAAGDPQTGADIVIITHTAPAGAARNAAARAGRMRSIMRGGPAVIRIEEG